MPSDAYLHLRCIVALFAHEGGAVADALSCTQISPTRLLSRIVSRCALWTSCLSRTTEDGTVTLCHGDCCCLLPLALLEAEKRLASMASVIVTDHRTGRQISMGSMA